MIASKAINSKTNMCRFCKFDFATCTPEIVEFGNVKGNYNVVVCSSFITKNINGDVEIEPAPEYGVFDRVE